jgi:hypothetical protein
MNMNIAKFISLTTVSILTSITLTSAIAAEDAGRVMFVAGPTKIIDAAGLERTAKKGDFLRQGDRIITAENAMVQVKMHDDGVMAIRPSTDIKLNNLAPRLDNAELPRQALLLNRGGVRVLTGNDQNKIGYLIKTTTTSIGLRDGDTEALVIPNGSRPADSDAGTYSRLNAGTGTMLAPDGKDVSLAANQVSFTSTAAAPLTLVASLPTSYINKTLVTLPPLTTTPIGAPNLASNTLTLKPLPTTPLVLNTPPPLVNGVAPATITPPLVVAGGGLPTKSISTTPPPIVLGSLTPPPVVVAPPTITLSPILIMNPVILPPPPPPVITTVRLAPTTTTPTLTSTVGIPKGTLCIKGIPPC